MDSEAAKTAALLAAASAVPRGASQANLITYAEGLIPWLTTPVTVTLDITISIDGSPVFHSSNGGEMATTLTLGVDNQVAILAQPKDASGAVTGDAITFSTDDTPGNILTATISADGRTWTGAVKPGVTGMVTVTANDATISGVPPATTTVTVVAGPTTHIDLTETVT